jgi:hypothetical protein
MGECTTAITLFKAGEVQQARNAGNPVFDPMIYGVII